MPDVGINYPAARALKRRIEALAKSEPSLALRLRHHKAGHCNWSIAIMSALIDSIAHGKALESELLEVLSTSKVEGP